MNEPTIKTQHQHLHYNSNPFSRSFKGLDLLFKYNNTLAITLLILSMFYFMLQILGSFIPGGDSDTGSSSSPASDNPDLGLILAIVIPIVLIIFIISIVISTYVYGLIYFVAWKTSRLETTTFGEAFKVVTGHFWTIFVIQVIVGLKILGGLLLFIVPGIRAALRYELVLFPVFEENLNSRKAIKNIKALTKGHLIELFGLATVSSLVPFIGLLLHLGGDAVLYPELKALKASGAPAPKAHWLNYLGLILMAGLIAVIAFSIIVAVTLFQPLRA